VSVFIEADTVVLITEAGTGTSVSITEAGTSVSIIGAYSSKFQLSSAGCHLIQ
jgi:hypothetical protein